MIKNIEKEMKHGASNWLSVATFGILIRVGLFISGYYDTFVRRVEINSPVASWYRVTECVTLLNNGISPYDGDICHHTLDVFTSLLLYFGTKVFVKLKLKEQDDNKKSFAKDVLILLLDSKAPQTVPLLTMTLYLLCPFTIVTCVAQSTVVINNVINACAFFAMLHGWHSFACGFIVISTYLSFYPIMLLVPVFLLIFNRSTNCCLQLFISTLVSLLVAGALLHFSYYVTSSWSFLHAVYGFVLQVPDLTPNMGLFWYFFMEMFDHFRLFFLWVYQLHVFIYILPLAIVFRKKPILVFYAFLSIMSLFKSYTTFGDVTLPLALLPLWSQTYRYMRNTPLIMGMFLFTTLLAPLMWHLWIYAGSGNANFFYAVTLAYNTAQIFLLTDVLYASLRHSYHLQRGLSPKTTDGKDGTVVMK